jgi:hypothetical protein
MRFQPGVSGNPQGRPKKLLKRVDEILSERGLEPLAEVLDRIARLEKTKGKGASVAKMQALRLWVELLPYVYARPKELPEVIDEVAQLPSQELAKRLLAAVPSIKKMAKTA